MVACAECLRKIVNPGEPIDDTDDVDGACAMDVLRLALKARVEVFPPLFSFQTIFLCCYDLTSAR